MAGVDIVSSAISPYLNLTGGLTGLRLAQADGAATVDTGRYHIAVDAAGVRVQDTQTQAWLESANLPASADPFTLVLGDGTKVTMTWVLGEVEAPPRLGSATVTRSDESVVIRIVASPASAEECDARPTLTAQKLQGLSSLWADAAQPDGRVLHAPSEAVPAGECGDAAPVLRWTPIEEGLAPVTGPSEADRLRADLFGVIRHTLVSGQSHVSPSVAPNEEDKADADRVRQQKLAKKPVEQGDALDSVRSSRGSEGEVNRR